MGNALASSPANRAAVYLCAGVAAAVLLVPFAFAVSTLTGLATLMLGSATLVLAAIAGGVRLHRPEFPRAWWLIFTSVGLALVGNVVRATVLPTSISDNAAAINVIYGVTYPILCTGVALLPNHHRPGAARIGMTESAIIASTVAVIWWMVFVDPTLIDTGSIRNHAYLLVEPFLDLVSVNVSPRRLREPDFGMMVLDALRSSALPPTALILEITEGVLVDSGTVTEQAVSHLSMLRSQGVRVAVDDVGTGYSSLASLRDLPIDHLKIDRSFIPVPGETDPAARPVVKAIVDLATGLGLGTIAEGLETAEQVELLRELGCERAQGFFFARPVPEPEAARLILASAPATVDQDATRG
ncbi:EAL domain-containing protein [Micromonosporaceae bacterium Da 78-11]